MLSFEDTLKVNMHRYRGYTECLVQGIKYFPHIKDPYFNHLHSQVPKTSPIQIGSYWNLYIMALQSKSIPGCFVECGVFAGGSAWFLASLKGDKTLHLFDTFEGMPETGERDTLHKKGDFADTSLEGVKEVVTQENVVFHKGIIPQTFRGWDEPIAFAHVDVDIYQSVKDCCEYLWPRLSKGGVMVFDDYGHFTCPGAMEAVEEYFLDKKSVPINMITGQAIVFKI